MDGAAEEIIDNPPAYLTPTYLTLNLSRVLYFIKKGKISSKREGGEWGVKNLPQKFQQLVNQCLNEYNGETDNSNVDSQNFLAFVEYMIQEIKQNISFS
ncbi:hypothetical protein BVG16_30785 [Paenibacillus selenitireducens]|uniref:Adenylyltransferase AadA C-terminal domain-containing protein n=1 Tax=Paenibacillus selenitireducens TaxID=1324314 RepID=A0A1T2X006_9BACL|nr:hypothetical protein BVG16_30785 [Paenibacillus selenitireducens]